MVAIFIEPLSPIAESVHTSPVVLLNPENVGVAFGISLLSCIEAENIALFHIYFQLMAAIFDLRLTLACIQIPTMSSHVGGARYAPEQSQLI